MCDRAELLTAYIFLYINFGICKVKKCDEAPKRVLSSHHMSVSAGVRAGARNVQRAIATSLRTESLRWEAADDPIVQSQLIESGWEHL